MGVPLPYVKFSDGFDPEIQYFASDIYQRADSAVCPCVKRFDSENPFDRRCSIVATNVIVRILNRDVVPSSWKLKGVAEQIRYFNGTPIPSLTIEEEFNKMHIREISPLFPFSFPYRTTQENAPQFELMRRTVNVFRTFYVEEVNSIKSLLCALKWSEERQEKELFGICPDSIVDAVAKRTRGDVQRLGLDWERTLPLVDPAPASEQCPCSVQ